MAADSLVEVSAVVAVEAGKNLDILPNFRYPKELDRKKVRNY